jgi:pilus assembly protein CpaC
MFDGGARHGDAWNLARWNLGRRAKKRLRLQERFRNDVPKEAGMFHGLVGGISQARQSGTSSAIRGQLPRHIALGRIGTVVALMAATIGIGVCGMGPARSQVRVVQEDPVPARQISVTRDKSRTLKLDKPFASAVVGAPDIADVLPMSDRMIYIQGKKVGTTAVSLFDQDKNMIGVIGLEVTIDIQNVASKIRAGTESPGIRVTSSNNQIVLSGVARDAVDAEKAVAIARGMATPPEGKEPEKYVVNAMRIAASQQVMLRVRFVEVSRQAERDIGVNWFGANASGSRGVNTGLGSVTQAGPSTGGLPVFQTLSTFAGSTVSAPFGVGLFNLANKGGSVDVLITALEQKGLARRLAEPDLVALSGDTASFLAGGEYPVPSVQSSSGTTPVITVIYKPFGVQLTFVPTVLSSGIINLRLTPSVSELDYTNAVTISGTQVPALSKREARTTIELRDGQSFAIAGLLQSDNLRDVGQLPWLGSVPVLGTLFRSTSYQQKETDLVVIVTPHLVAPAAPGQALATPFDKQLPGNDVDLFLMGRPEVRKQYTDYLTSGGEQKGPYGHMMPQEPK